MTVYYFDIQIGDSPRSVDEEGQSLPSVDAARLEAGLMLCELARDIMQSRKATEDVQVWVRDDLGEVLQNQN